MPSAGTSCYETASSGSGAFMCMQFDKSMHAGSNPFPVGDPRQLLWADAANRAEERIARLIKDFTFTEATDVLTAEARFRFLAIAQLDILSEECLPLL